MQTLIIDNYDSYTFNLYQMIAEVNGELPLVIYNDQLNWDELKEIAFDNIVISPGPGRPERSEDFGVCRQIIENVDVPLLGVCLGHQGLGYLHGARVIHAPEVRHGRLSKIDHNNSELFQGIPNQFSVVRYHSLLVADELPECLEKIAWTEEGLVMGLRHRHLPFWGVQFHPESICTEYGQKLLANFRDITLQFPKKSSRSPEKQYWMGYESVTPVMDKPCQKQEEKFELYTRKLDICPNTEQIFVQLFGDAANAFWLDSSRVELGLSRFSFMGDGSGVNSLLVRYHTQTQEIIVTQSDTVTRRTESIFEYLKREIDCRFCQSDELPFDFNCGFVGYFGYELKAECGSSLVHSSPLPDAIFLLCDRMIAIDHQEQCLYLLQLIKKGQTEQVETWFDTIQEQLETLDPLFSVVPQENCQPVKFRLSRTYQNYIQDIQQCLDEIHEGETYQVCLTNQLYTDATPDPLTFYRTLRKINPAPYSAFLRFGEIAMPAASVAIACSSPERFLRIDRQGWVETKPIKGTLPRGETPEADFVLREKLRNSEKDRAENLMIVDLLRNDLGRVCEIGSIHVPKLMDVETYSTVHQLVTTVRGRLRSDLQALDCVRAAFPGGSMTGAPKIRTMQIIDRLEQEARGVYSGAIGFLGLNGSADLNIVIRTAVLTPNQTSIGIGGGIIALSEPEMEFQETLLKAKALIDALLLTIHGTSEPDVYPILGLEATTADSYEKLSA
ncbi:aminodeoxychorismate synthase component I [Nostoc sp. 'Peltigera malacea cyanobiont' DB3992]|uniref:aminodeoxychorismate synthase component I n=1 Tax=Nostoc sp. 'Peltigera malacea cyanobiont' DB3992 TaxID=1206980 RepID=UPI000C038B9A|nr:aminodeoxychorismate synthase component I [Nostoc sp. 'Peltigera malacea cyanobiont' DB3992]PHM07967.1 aminodeoxychorismate synthase, component I [Nostoc sp. 'Peltigera malacea cyanobiont' DB3992]